MTDSSSKKAISFPYLRPSGPRGATDVEFASYCVTLAVQQESSYAIAQSVEAMVRAIIAETDAKERTPILGQRVSDEQLTQDIKSFALHEHRLHFLDLRDARAQLVAKDAEISVLRSELDALTVNRS